MARMYPLGFGDDRWINLDRVDTIRAHSRKNRHGVEINHYTFYRDNESVAEWDAGGEHPEFSAVTAPVIPAAPGQQVYALSAENDTVPSGRPNSVFVQRFAVVAWRMTEGLSGDDTYAMPVIASHEPGSHILWLIQQPDGRFYETGFEGALFETLESAKAHVLARDQETYDRVHSKENAPADLSQK